MFRRSRIIIGMTPSLTTSHRKPARLANLNPTKRRVLELLAEYFCLRTKDAATLLRKREATETDARSVRRTLSILHRDGFLERLAHIDLTQERGGMTRVWGLSDKGVEHAVKNGYATSATKSFDDHSRRTLDHELEISTFHMALERFTVTNNLPYTWQQADLKRTVHPDALFTMPDRANPDREFCYFLEIERSKFGHYVNGEPQILRKLGAYYEYFNSTGCEKEWGFGSSGSLWYSRRTRAVWDSSCVAGPLPAPHVSGSPRNRCTAKNVGGDIFKTPKDHTERLYSLLAI